MDISKYHIPQLIGPNWGPWYERIQSTARIINIWDAMRGNVLTQTPTVTRDLLAKPTSLTGTYTAAELAAYTAAKKLMGSKEFPRSRSHTGHHNEHHLATVWKFTNSQRNSQWPRDRIWSCGGGTDLPPTGQHGENSNHRWNGSITTDPKLSG